MPTVDTKSLMLKAALVIALGHASLCPAASQAGECLTSAELSTIDQQFWGEYPSARQFARYAAPDLTIASNVADLADATKTHTDGAQRAQQFASFLGQHPEYFGVFKQKHAVSFLYYPGADRHPDAVKTAARFPANRCVSMFNYELEQRQCVSGQRVRSLSLSFVKADGKVQLQVAQVALEACGE
jgi:uncharacterized UBP type Zn finger protein